MAVVIETTVGDLTVDLYLDERPRACLNFLKLCKLKYYNFNLFHNIEHGFIAQTGDPTGVGDGGESVWGVVEGTHKRYFEAESLPKIKHSSPGLLSMVSVGKNLVGSQFFFTLGPDLTSLDGVHCVIGEVTDGHDVLRILNEAIVDEKYRPFQDIRITHTVILEDPFDDPRGFQIPSRSPSPSAERLKNGRIGADEDIDDTEGKTAQEIQEMLQEREAKARATILEIVGDLPDADIAPPENVLFVCKLNPVTTDDDLEIIFSRFGKVKGCEVIRDKVSGDSLQYAFVEFEDKKACENAYFKMDNVLIDDRRIHVDFSQSVAKVKWRGKGRGIVRSDGKDGRLDFNDLRGSGKSTNNPKRSDYRRDEQQRGRPRDDRLQHARRPNPERQSRSPERARERKDYRQRSSSPKRPDRRSRSRSPYRQNRPQYDSNYRRRENNNRPEQNQEQRRDRFDDRNRSRRPRSRSPRRRERSPNLGRYDPRSQNSRPGDRYDRYQRNDRNQHATKLDNFSQRRSYEKNRDEAHSSKRKVLQIDTFDSKRSKKSASSAGKHSKSKKTKRKHSSSSESSSSEESDASSSDSEERKKKSRKNKSKKSMKKKSKKHRSTSPSDSTSSD